MLKYADQIHTLKSEPKDVVYLTNTQNWVWGPTFFRNLIIQDFLMFELKKIYLLSKKKYIQVCKEGNICFSKKRLPCCFQYSSDCSFYPCPSRVYTY